MTRKMHVAVVGGVEPKVHFNQVLESLTRLAMPDAQLHDDHVAVKQYGQRRKSFFQQQFKRLGGNEADASKYNAGQVYAIAMIQSAARGYLHRHHE